MARKKEIVKIASPLSVHVDYETISLPVPQRTPLDDKKSEWESRRLNYLMPYRTQNISQRIMGETAKYHLDPIWMTDKGVNTTTKNEYYRTDRPYTGD